MVQKCLYQKSRKGPATVGVTQSFIELLNMPGRTRTDQQENFSVKKAILRLVKSPGRTKYPVQKQDHKLVIRIAKQS